MLKAATLALIAYVGLAASEPTEETDVPPTFPDIDTGFFNGKARLFVSYENKRCGRLFDRFNDIIDGFSNEDPGEGKYSQKTKSFFTKSWISAKRTDKRKTETDEVQFFFTQVGRDCHVRGQAAQIRGVNVFRENPYCAVWDVLKYSDVFNPGSLYVSTATFTPKDPDHDCVHYPKPWRPSYAQEGDDQFDEVDNQGFLNE